MILIIFFWKFSVVARQPDSLDSVEGESSLPYDTVPIRLDQTGKYNNSIFIIAEFLYKSPSVWPSGNG